MLVDIINLFYDSTRSTNHSIAEFGFGHWVRLGSIKSSLWRQITELVLHSSRSFNELTKKKKIKKKYAINNRQLK